MASTSTVLFDDRRPEGLDGGTVRRTRRSRESPAVSSVARRETQLALALSLVAGAGVSVQAFVNGHLSDSLGSAVAAAVTNNGLSLAILLTIAVFIGSLPRAWKELRADRNPIRIWWFFGGLLGAGAVYSTTLAAPILGIALMTVALVLGQLIGSLVTDALALGPAGRHLPSPRRLIGTFCALSGVVIGALGQEGRIQLALLLLLVLIGALVTVQQAGNAQLIQATKEPTAMGVLNFLTGSAMLVIVLALTPAGMTPLAAVPAWGWIGGAIGAGVAVFGAVAARTLGVLKLFLGLVAGQSMAGLVLDLAAPRPGHSVTVAALTGVVLACAAVIIASWPANPAPGAPSSSDAPKLSQQPIDVKDSG